MADPASGLRLQTRDDVDTTRWGELIDADPFAGPLHAPEVQRIVARGIAGAVPRWIEVEDASGELVAGLPIVQQSRWGLSKVVSGASGLYAGPVVRPGAEDAVPLLAEAFRRLGGIRTVRRELVWAGSQPPAGKWAGLRPLPTSVLRVDPGCDFDADYEGGLRRTRRKERRRLLEAGYSTAQEGGALLEEFFPIYASRAREWSSRAVPREVLASLLALGPEWLAFGVRDATGRLLGAHVCIDLGDELFAWLGTTERVDRGSLATLLIEAELRWCHAEARSGLNLGTSADLSGVADFKRGIRAEEDPRWIVRWQRGKGFQ